MNSRADYCYLTVVKWPKVMDEEARAAAVGYATAQPTAACRVYARREAPCIVAALPREAARAAAKALREAGVPALYPGDTDFALVRPPFMCRRLSAALGASEPLYLCEPWAKRAEPRGINMAHAVLIIRARIKSSTSATQTELDFTFGPNATVLRSTSSVTTNRLGPIREVVDIYCEPPGDSPEPAPPVRLDGSRFAFDILGAQKGMSDFENMSKLATILAEQAPGAVIDLDFPKFPTPPRTTTSRVVAGGNRQEDEGPAFEFYSAWKYFVERAIRKARP